MNRSKTEADIREEGHKAYIECKSINANPYQVNTLEWAFWYSGWSDAQTPDTEIEESDD